MYMCELVCALARAQAHYVYACMRKRERGRGGEIQTDRDRNRTQSLWTRMFTSFLYVLTIPKLTHVKHFHVRNEENIPPLIIQLIILGVTVRFIGCNS